MAAFGVAHHQDTEEQAGHQDSHGGQAGALDSTRRLRQEGLGAGTAETG